MKSRTTGTYILIAIAALIAVGLCVFGSISSEAVYPIERVVRLFRDRVMPRVSGMFAASSANAENVRLRREIASLAMVRGDNERLENENARLRDALGYMEKNRGVWVPASVISRSGGAAAAHMTLRVDKGTIAGVRKGAVVTVPEGLVGIVDSVSPHTAEILLITDRSLKVSCAMEGYPGSHGILCGGTEDVLVVERLKGVAGIPPRTRVLTSGLGGVFPKGMAVGMFLPATDVDGESAREGEVEPAVDFSALEDVFIRSES